jgi:hypothetical protein
VTPKGLCVPAVATSMHITGKQRRNALAAKAFTFRQP